MKRRQIIPWLIAAACFVYLYSKLSGGAERAGTTVLPYLAATFATVSWGQWLALMIPYSALFFAVDTLVVWRVINWFNTRVPYRDMLPIRGSSYILSILNEQVGKGAMGLYLNRRYQVPGWEVGSSMLFVMFCEFFYLLGWATLGTWIAGDQLPEVFSIIPKLAAGGLIFLILFHLVMSGALLPNLSFRERPVFQAFRMARWWYYPTIMAMRSPAMLVAVVVYASVLQLFGIEIAMIAMLGYLPIIFFGAATPGPMRTVAITLWVALFPEQDPAKMTAFGLVQHNFFIFFNASIGVLFLRRANRELFGSDQNQEPTQRGEPSSDR